MPVAQAGRSARRSDAGRGPGETGHGSAASLAGEPVDQEGEIVRHVGAGDLELVEGPDSCPAGGRVVEVDGLDCLEEAVKVGHDTAVAAGHSSSIWQSQQKVAVALWSCLPQPAHV